MNRRLDLHEKLCELFESTNVYYQPPGTIKMEYPAIVYSKDDVDKRTANNAAYITTNRYEIIVIDKKPDNPVVDKILELPYSSYTRSYKAENLNHEVLTLYY